MISLQNLYELKARKDMLIKEYSEEHDFEICYQRYYNFLIKDFYNFILKLLNSYGRGNLDSLEGQQLTFPIEENTEEFIANFIGYNDLGNYCYSYDDDGNTNMTITLGKIDFDKLITCFYNELQMVERTMKSKEEMDAELDNFKRENTSWISEKQKNDDLKNGLDSVMEDHYYDDYYKFLVELRNRTYEYFSGLGFIDSEPWEAYKSFDLSCAPFAYDFIVKFLSDYQLGFCKYAYDSVIIKLNASAQEVNNAYFMEIQRLKYYIEENKSNLSK